MTAALPRQRPLFALLIRLAAMVALSTMALFVKLASESGIHIAEILFWRQFITLPLLGGWLALTGQAMLFTTRRPGMHAKRAAYGMTGMVLIFTALTLLPLAEATVFNFTSTIWAVILSVFLLREKVGRYRWLAVILGFTGVLVIAQPGGGNINLAGAAAALGGAFMVALISIQIRDMNRTEHQLTIVFYFAAFSAPVLLCFMPFVFAPHDMYQWLVIAGLGLSGLAGQVLLTLSLRFGAVASVIVMDYSSLIWATLFGLLVFGNIPPVATWFGAPLIVVAGLIIAYREHKLSIARDVPPAAA
ncbi:DMT family transporter [Altererythrobacter aquiaggeris]|uniref:DMT family transporter n=1 Tax=Aestuarierythrobacter aquiaggeris TaxID=1898396 RepID=UPI0030171E5B